MLDWGLRVVVAGGAVCGGLADVAQPLVATLYHYGLLPTGCDPDHVRVDGLRGWPAWVGIKVLRQVFTPARTSRRLFVLPLHW
jgi:hypothetical protein